MLLAAKQRRREQDVLLAGLQSPPLLNRSSNPADLAIEAPPAGAARLPHRVTGEEAP
jgi:hypothetical protein